MKTWWNLFSDVFLRIATLFGLLDLRTWQYFSKARYTDSWVSLLISFVLSFALNHGVGDFDTDFTLNIFDNVNKLIRRLFFEFISKLLSEKGMSSLSMMIMIDAEIIIFRIESPNRVELRTFNRSSIETPITTFYFTIDYIICFITFGKFKLKCVLKSIGRTFVSELLDGIELISNIESNKRKTHTHR